MAKGKLIVLEGIDGSGKSAQYRRLCARFDEMGMAYHHIVFPRYDQESSALIRMYLNGAFGAHPSDVNAYAASTFFAGFHLQPDHAAQNAVWFFLVQLPRFLQTFCPLVFSDRHHVQYLSFLSLRYLCFYFSTAFGIILL